MKPAVVSLDARGTDDVERTFKEVIPSARLETAEPRDIRLGWRSVAVPDFSLVHYELAASISSSIDPDDQLVACRVASREGSVRNTRRELDAGLPWVSIDGPTRSRWRGTAQVRAMIFDRRHAVRMARQMSGDDRLLLRPDDGAPRNRQSGEQWERTFRHLASSMMTLAGGESEGDALILAELRRHALHTTLLTFPSTLSLAVERTAQRGAAPKTVKRAIAYLEEHAAEPVTIDDAAAAAGISTRGLQYAFRRALGTTPTEYLRTLRLAGAHDQLTKGDGSVRDVARRWGFASPSRFARQYREAYGRNPSQTRRAG